MAVQDLQPIFQSRRSGKSTAIPVKQHGQSAMKAAEKQRDLLLDELADRPIS